MLPHTPLLLALLYSLLVQYVAADVFTVGYLTGAQRRPGTLNYDKPGIAISGAMTLAAKEVNEYPNGTLASRGHRLNFIVAETYGEEKTSILETAQLWKRNVTAFIGPQETCFHEARMATAFNLPMISYFCTDQATSDKHLFPTFARTRPPETQISKSVASVLLHFDWTHVVFLYLNASEEVYGKIAQTILETFELANIHVEAIRTWESVYVYGHGYEYEVFNPFPEIVEDTFKDTRIYVILAHQYEHLALLVEMEDRKLFDRGEYFVVGVDIEQYNLQNPTNYLRSLLSNQRDYYLEKASRSYMAIFPTPPREFDRFAELVNNYLELEPFSYPNPLKFMGGKKEIRIEAAYLYDAVHLYSKAVVDILDQGGDPYNGTAVVNAIKGSRYRSAMGYMVYMDNNGDAEGNYTLLARQAVNESAGNLYGLYPVGVFSLKSNDTKLPVLEITHQIEWVRGRPPVAVLRCGFHGEKCKTHTGQIIAGVIGGGCFVLIIVFLVLYRNWRYEQELDSLLWKIDYREIEIHEDNNANIAAVAVMDPSGQTENIGNNYTNSKPMTRFLHVLNKCSLFIKRKCLKQIIPNLYLELLYLAYETNHPLIRTSQVSLSSNPDADFRYSSIFTKIGIYKSRIYAIKTVHKKSIDITREMKKELKMMRDLRHNNLNAFVGACTDPPNICIITEYCSRGSLKDILENDEVKLDNMFVASIVGDILRGMIYLHESAVRYHGALCPANCLVDSRWVVKVADFGLREFKRGSDESEKYSGQDSAAILSKCEALLYRAPELVRAKPVTSCPNSGHQECGGDGSDIPTGTQRGDVYSFSVILYELHSRHGPFGETGLSAPEILQRVINHKPPAEPFRPNLESLENSFDFVRDCLKECWAENPEERPDFKTIRTKLRPLRKGMKPNIFDNMMAMMEKYANNLEVLVDERTDLLQEEKKKTEALLLEMLPKPVVEQLKRGQKVEAESFDCVTIYFSDIVGFTSMSAESTPLQVVDFLNDLYTCFDSIIENYDVYKVETIGDAYMVVSGLPIRNGDQHAGEVATMSLHLLSAVRQFTIRHRPNNKLMLRIGIHSGPVVAGVVGLKMPRYCLFGDTVNTSSRMESTGQPLKIHCSKKCKDLLDKLGGYTLLERGLVEMKGKGEQMTYWLIGEDDDKRKIRTDERNLRRAHASGKHSRTPETNGQPGVPRSSLKSKSMLPKSPLPRCSSLESPKRLRFASAEHLENIPKKKKDFLEVITDNSPVRKSSGSLIEVSIDPASDPLKTSSSSCPCIENITNSTATLAQSQLSMFSKECDKHNRVLRSIPTLTLTPSGFGFNIPKICSAPTSPKKNNITIDMSASSITLTINEAAVPLLSSSANELYMDRDTAM